MSLALLLAAVLLAEPPQSSQPRVAETKVDVAATPEKATPPQSPKLKYDSSNVILNFDGGEIGAEMARALGAVHGAGELPTRVHVVAAGETPCGVLVKNGFPPACSRWLPLLMALNPGLDPNRVSVGYNLAIPSVQSQLTPTLRVFIRENPTERRAAYNLEQQWASKNARVEDTPGKPLRVVYDSYRIIIPTRSDASARAVVSALREKQFPTANMGYNVNWVAVQARGDVFSWPAKDALEQCDGKTALSPRFYTDLLPTPSEELMKKVLKKGLEAAPTVFILDEPLLGAPNIAPSLGAAAATKPAACTSTGFDRGVHHATHMAGIVGGDGYGFEGVAPKVHIVPIRWFDPAPAPGGPNLRGDAVLNFITTLAENEDPPQGPRNIYLFASRFPDEEIKIVDGLIDPEDRAKYSPGREISKLAPILIAAAGQDVGQYIFERTPRGPQNLGDWPNVIVVTACSDCTAETAKIMPEAFYSDRVVHIAAPGGEDIAGWIGPGQVAGARGTSQSAAFVAGVAANMLARYPQSYIYGNAVKMRLQVTAWPMLDGVTALPGEAKKLRVGIVDPARAQLNPNENWMFDGKEWTPVRLKPEAFPVSAFGTSIGQKVKGDVADVRRLVMLKSGDTPVYAMLTKEGEGAVARAGPFRRLAKASLQTCGGAIDLATVQDLIIRLNGIGSNECSAP